MDQDTLINKFLEESNNIEDIWDKESLERARHAWNFLIRSNKLRIANILWTHRILMKGHLPGLKRGRFRWGPVWIGGQEKEWTHIQDDMLLWIDRANKLEDEILDHILFEEIHPFWDGNGRMGRILLNWQRVKKDLPILVIEEKNKDKYYRWFQPEWDGVV